ncbi:MAG: PHP domain-containing protein [Gloeocapsa sp. DLM2.Bin57]|nr:MAG: PHP domain-containing protein [Gloeocapsa sp. DLM2.Bin57]
MTSLTNQNAAQDGIGLKTVWSQIRADSCPYHYNFHLHTYCSDGQLSPEQIIEQGITLGLKGLAISDHHSVEGYYLAQKYLKTLRHNYPKLDLPQLWTGVEITSDLKGVEVHLLGYAFDPEHPQIKHYFTGKRPSCTAAEAAQVIYAIQAAGGLAVLAHPARYHQPAKRLVPLVAQLGIDALEVYYAYGNPKPWFPSPQETEEVKQLAESYNLLMTCGTDTHGSNILQRI